MTDRELRRRAFYLVPKENRVVVVKELSDHYLTVEDPTDGTVWTLRREPFEDELEKDRIVRVTPNWEPAGQPVEA